MTTRSERDRQKALQEKHQAILSKLLKDDDNKYCVDCDAKGPRWASWNLGVFLCIRCAGIHRNLGVHISKVKSVNLDTWTPEQIAMMEEMGNSRARAVYEANLPDHVRRPQTDSSLEAFIRAKYEQKKYIAKEWVPPKPKIPTTVVEEPRREKRRSRPKQPQIQLTAPANKPTGTSKPETKPTTSVPKIDSKSTNEKSNVDDLLGLDDPAPSSNGPNTSNDDIFSGFMSNPVPSTNPTPQDAATPCTAPAAAQAADSAAPASSAASELDEALFGENSQAGENAKSTKDSIMALFGPGTSGNQQMFGIPGGMYMQQPGGMLGGTMQNGMMGNSALGMMPNNMMQQQQQQPNIQQYQNAQQSNLMVADPIAALKTNIAAQPQPNQYQVPIQHNMNWDQMASMASVQINMGGVMMGGMQQQQQQQPGMMGMQQPQGVMMQQQQPHMYNMQQQPMQMTQMQNQMSGLNLGGAGTLGGFQQSLGMGNSNWSTQQTGQTLSTNLWQ